ncbi:MFS transporter [Paenibacillus albiflavus]|uniref:MFS transporter n=1 Tax=Paenibacillus albiflavus TaxID=2545760 RepID=A0A4R4EEZ0_9BACL|nr:MFS transporter [Paenibacillus albiflavus]TCZ76625.1 MFS transporter [Paenibacillus albiflavus]
MKELFANRNFVKMFTATFASQFGTIVGNMAFAFFLLDRFSTQPGYASLAEMMYSLPTLLVFWVVGVTADRFNRQKIAEYSGWIRVMLTVLLVLVIYMEWLPLAFAVLFLRSAVSKFYAPAETALLQGVLKPDQYEQASGLNQMLMGLFMMFGVGLGAVAYQTIGIVGAVALDGVGLTLSALLIRKCEVPEAVRQPNGAASWRGMKFRKVWSDFAQGLGYIRQKPLLQALICGFLLFGLLNGGISVLPLYTMKYKLAPDNYTVYSSLYALFMGVGMLVGSLIGVAIVKKAKPHIVIISGIFVAGLLVIGLLQATNPWVFLSFVLLVGLILAPVNIAIGGWLPALIDPRQMGRVSAWYDPLMMLGQTVALGLIAWLYPGTIGLNAIYWSMCIILLLASFFYLLTLPRLRRKEEAKVASNSEIQGVSS